MNDAGHFHTIARTNNGHLAVYRVARGRTFVAIIPTDIRFPLFRGRRIRRRLEAAFMANDVAFLLIEGDVKFDVELSAAIKDAGNVVGTKVIE